MHIRDRDRQAERAIEIRDDTENLQPQQRHPNLLAYVCDNIAVVHGFST